MASVLVSLTPSSLCAVSNESVTVLALSRREVDFVMWGRRVLTLWTPGSPVGSCCHKVLYFSDQWVHLHNGRICMERQLHFTWIFWSGFFFCVHRLCQVKKERVWSSAFCCSCNPLSLCWKCCPGCQLRQGYLSTRQLETIKWDLSQRPSKCQILYLTRMPTDLCATSCMWLMSQSVTG